MDTPTAVATSNVQCEEVVETMTIGQETELRLGVDIPVPQVCWIGCMATCQYNEMGRDGTTCLICGDNVNQTTTG